MLAQWDHQLPQLLLHSLAAILSPVTKNIQSVVQYIETNCDSVASFVKQMADELQIKLEDETLLTPENSLARVEPAQKKRKITKLELLKQISTTEICRKTVLELELEKYLSINLSDEEILNFDLLNWWRTHRLVFPTLAKLARGVFAIPATAAQIERVWSTGGLTITSRRANISCLNVKYLLFCQENY